MALDLLLTPNPWMGPWYMSTLYVDNLDATNFGGTLNIGTAKIGSTGRINIGATGVPVYIDGILYNPVVGSGYSVIAPVAASDNNGIIINNTSANIGMELADTTHNGILSTTTQSIAGFKTFTTGITSPVDGTLHNVFYGTGAGASITTGSRNFAAGYNALNLATITNDDVAIGYNALALASIGGGTSVAIGSGALGKTTQMANSTAIGFNTLGNLTGTGFGNIAIGHDAGSAYTNSEAGNICIGNAGVVGESNVTRIGGTLTSKVYITGISGITTGGSAVAVLIDSNGNLGTVSSERYLKENIEPLGDVRNIIKNLKPYSFNMIADESKSKTIGFMADEFEQILPEFVVTQAGGVRTIQYHLLATLYLKEIQRLQGVVESLQTQINEINYQLQSK